MGDAIGHGAGGEAAQTSGISAAAATIAADPSDNRFTCPLPALSAGCGMNNLAFARRDAHHVAADACEMPGIAYHALHEATTV